MSRLTKLLSAIIGAAMCLSVMGIAAGCDNNTAPEGSVSINFWYDCGLDSQPVYRELVKTYNDTQGIQDGVYVVGTRKTGISISARTQLTGGTPPNVIMISDRVFRAYARDGLFLNLDEFYETAPGAYTKDTIPENMTSRFRISVGTGGAKTVVGAGETLLGVPFGCVPAVLFYNVSYFNGQGIHIISVPEEELDAYNKAHRTNFAPHGYAEYAPGFLTGDAASLSASANLADQQVVKVFNNAIPTNWEEFRNLCKYFTKEYNAASPTARAYGNEWWFANGSSGGGRMICVDEVKWIETDSGGEKLDVLYVNGPTITVQPRFDSLAEYVNIAQSGKVSLVAGELEEDSLPEYLTDGLLSYNTSVSQNFLNKFVRETVFKGEATFEIVFEDAAEIRGFMVYGSKFADRYFTGVYDVEITVTEYRKNLLHRGTSRRQKLRHL